MLCVSFYELTLKTDEGKAEMKREKARDGSSRETRD